MKAIATRGRSYGNFFVGARLSREGWSFGFQVLGVVWGSHGGASGDVPRLRGDVGTAQTELGPPEEGRVNLRSVPLGTGGVVWCPEWGNGPDGAGPSDGGKGRVIIRSVPLGMGKHSGIGMLCSNGL